MLQSAPKLLVQSSPNLFTSTPNAGGIYLEAIMSKSTRCKVHLAPLNNNFKMLLLRLIIVTRSLSLKSKTMVNTETMTMHEVAARFDELAQQEKWFEIQDELFAENVRSIDPANSPYLGYAEGKAAVHKKGKDFVDRIEAVHRMYTSKPLVSGNHFTVGREMDITVEGHGRIQINEIMLYEVKDGQIVVEQFFY